MVAGDDASPQEPLGNAGKGGEGDACARRWGKEGCKRSVDTAIEQRDGTRRGCNDFEGSKGRGGGGKRIGPALSSIAGGPH